MKLSKVEKTISISRKRQSVMREDYLISGVGRRAVHLAMLFAGDSSKPISSLLSEHQLHCLLIEAAKAACKKGWKMVWVVRQYGGTPNCEDWNISICNISRHEVQLGKLGGIIEKHCFLNQHHLTPKAE
jgi:hypothetical protein